MTRLKKIQKDTIITMLAFFIPALVMMLIFIMGDFAPFGKVSILLADMQYQFVDYIGYLKSVFFDSNDLLYSFSKTFGGDMSGFTAYYLSNPFYLILLLFPNDILPIGIVWMIILMCGASGLTFYIMLRGIWENRFSSLIFSTAYAFMGYYVAYINCIHYFFSVMMLPLIILGLFQMVRSRKMSILYVITTAAAVISNYYIGYMILIFTAVFFLYILFSDVVEFNDIRDRVKTCFLVLYSTMFAVGISAFSLFAVVFSLQGQKKSGLHLALSRTFNIFEFFSGLYSRSFHGNISDGLPIIYSSVISVMFLLFYFLNTSIKLKDKILTAALFAFIILGFWIDALNVAWHGFAHPIGFPYRNSFLFSFLVIFFGYKGFVDFKIGFKKLHVLIVLALFVIYSAYLLLIGSNYADLKSIIATFVPLTIAIMCVVAMCIDDKYVVSTVIGLIVLQIFDLYGNGLYSINSYYEDKNDPNVSLETFSNYINETQELVDLIEANDDSFYRMEKLYRRTHNDPMMFSYNGLSHFSSCESDQVKSFMGKLGFRNNGLWAFYGQGSTSFVDCLMGLKYQLSQYDEIPKPYERIFANGTRFIFKNPYALPIGFTMNKSVKGLSTREKDPFKLQNEIASNFVNTKFEIYRPVKVDSIVLNNVIQDGDVYTIENDMMEASVEYVLSINSSDYIYMFFDAPELQNANVNVNGMDKGSYFNQYDWSVRECGFFKPGEKISVKIILGQNSIEISNALFYYESSKILKAWYDEVNHSQCNIDKITSSHLVCDVDIKSSNNLIVFSIPYEKDWKVTLDGEKVNTTKVMDALMAIDVPEGKHTIDMVYFPRGFIVGVPISIMSVLTTFCVFFIQNNKKIQEKKNNKKSLKIS